MSDEEGQYSVRAELESGAIMSFGLWAPTREAAWEAALDQLPDLSCYVRVDKIPAPEDRIQSILGYSTGIHRRQEHSVRITGIIRSPLRASFSAVLAAGLMLSGCGSHGSTGHAAARASASALASVPGADARAILVRAGVPLNGTSAQQLAFARSMLVKASRQALAAKLAIPPAQRPAFEAAVLDAAKHDHLSTHAGRVQFLDDDLPNLVARFA